MTLSSYGDFVYTGADSAKIYYTLDGATPTTSSTLYTKGSHITIPSGENIKAIRYYEPLELTSLVSSYPASAMVLGSNTLPAPEISISADKVTITCPIYGVAIYYTLDGSDPDTAAVGGSNPTKYYNGTPFDAPGSGTIKAIATKTGMTASSVTTFLIE